MRFIVVGSSCAGKSSFARALAQASGCPHIELDELHWGPGWQPKSAEEFRRLVAQAGSAEEWIADGNYSGIRELLWPRACAIIWLNYSYHRVLWQALKRTLKRSLGRELLWHGNRESLQRSFFSRDSILWWVITTYHRRQRDFQALRASGRFAHLTWFEFTHPRQSAQWLAERQLRTQVTPPLSGVRATDSSSWLAQDQATACALRSKGLRRRMCLKR